MRFKNSLLPIGIFVFLGLMVAPVFVKLPEIQLPSSDRNRPNFELSEIEMSMFNHPYKEWDISAQKAAIYTKVHQTQIEEISGVIYDKDTSKAIKFTSPKALLNNDHTRFDFDDTTWSYLKTQPTLTFFAPELLWDTEKNLIKGNQSIQLNSPVYQMNAQRFQTSIDEDRLLLSGGVSVKIRLEP